jgi:hypothetical protein
MFLITVIPVPLKKKMKFWCFPRVGKFSVQASLCHELCGLFLSPCHHPVALKELCLTVPPVLAVAERERLWFNLACELLNRAEERVRGTGDCWILGTF